MDELTYHPILADAREQVRELRPAQVLIVGADVPDAVDDAGEVRHYPRPPVDLPTGVYAFRSVDLLAMMIVSTGGAPGVPTGASWSDPDDDPLVASYGWFCDWWDEAVAIPRPAFAVGDEALLIPGGEEARIRSRSFDAGTWWYRVRAGHRTTSVREAALERPVVDDDPVSWVRQVPAPAERFGATLTRSKLAEHLTDTVYSFRATRTLFRPYQFRPVIRLLASERLRLLIADEVGLGKTIEAGLVWTELDARNLANRVLVVCPSMLVPKWRAEMYERFSYELRELDREGLDELLRRAEEDRIPQRFHAIASIERLRGWPGLDRLAEIAPRIDLVICDEAHAFRNAGTRSNALGAVLSDWADALVFLTATPLNLGNRDLYNLLELLAPGEFENPDVLEQRLQPNVLLNRIAASVFDPNVDNAKRRVWLEAVKQLAFGKPLAARPEYQELASLLEAPALTHRAVVQCRRLVAQLHALSAVVTRTRKLEIQEHKAVREAVPVAVPWTDREYEFYAAYEAWQYDRARKLGLPPGFATQMPLRLASSCLPAARDHVLEFGSSSLENDFIDDEHDLALDDEDRARAVLEVPPPQELVALAHRLGDLDSKFDAFLNALLPIVHARKRVLVFTFSRRALAYLQRRLEGRLRFGVLHGDVVTEDRHALIRRFRAHEFDVLLASRVASEGLDFEFCSAIVNYDLPWNPMEVEQRIGRIDRFGQAEDKILILNLHTPGTIESDIIERIHHRIGVFSDSIGELEPIIRSHLRAIERTVFDFELTPEQRQRRLDHTIAAIEDRRLTREELEEASSYLASTDSAEIEGLERDLLTSGRYVGQQELVLLIEDWVARRSGASCKRSQDGARLAIRGTAEMEADLRQLAASGERSALELDDLARALRNEQEIVVCLDQELARSSMLPLLTANHPLTRAALRVPGHALARFANLAVRADDSLRGEYLVLLAIARWTGLRSTAEFWGAAVDLRDNSEASTDVVDALLSALASGQLSDAASPVSHSLEIAVERAQRQLRRRQAEEEQRRIAANNAMIETRRVSLRETHDRKVEQIRRRIETARSRDEARAVQLNEAQLRHQERLLMESETALDRLRQGSMQVEYVAACVVHVEPA